MDCRLWVLTDLNFQVEASQIVERSCNYDVLLTAPLPDNLIVQNEGGLSIDWFWLHLGKLCKTLSRGLGVKIRPKGKTIILWWALAFLHICKAKPLTNSYCLFSTYTKVDWREVLSSITEFVCVLNHWDILLMIFCWKLGLACCFLCMLGAFKNQYN